MQITNRQAEVENAAEFRRRFMVLHQAGVGVTLCRSREPFRAIETLRDFAFAETLDFKVWTITSGWATHDRTSPEAEPTCDNAAEPFGALRAINGAPGQTGFANGIYVMMFPHHFLPKHPGMMQVVKEYARYFAECKKRLVLLTPLGFTLPQELEDDVVILDFDTPSYAEVVSIYDRLVSSISDAARRPFFGTSTNKAEANREHEEAKQRLISLGGGMTSHEYENALARALVTHRQKLPNVPVDDFAAVLMGVKTEVVKRSNVLELLPTENMENVGGLENLKAWIGKRKCAFSEEAAEFGVEAPKGIALIGPPGTGKSLVAKAIGATLGLPAIRFDVGKVFGSLVGQSEERVRAALKMVDGMAPCVLMIDEVDKAFQANSGGGDSGTSQRVLGTILTWMQETKEAVFMVVTANRVNNLPSEFLRKGRLDEVFSVAVPAEDERLEILQIHLRKRGHDPALIDDLQVAVEASAGYVPSELEGAVKDTLIEAFSEDVPVTGELIKEQLGNMKPLSEAFKEDFDLMQAWASANARPANRVEGGGQKPGVRARSRVGSPAQPRAIPLEG